MRATCVLIAVLLASGFPVRSADKPDGRALERRKELEKKLQEMRKEGDQHANAHDFAGARELFGQALEISRVLYPKRDFPNGSPELADCMQDFGAMHLFTGNYDQAEPLLREALQMKRALFPKEKYPQEQPNLLTNLSCLAQVYEILGAYDQAEPLYREELEIKRGLYPKKDFPQGDHSLATTIGALGNLYRRAGEYGKAEPLCRESLEIARALYPKKGDSLGQMSIGGALQNLARLYIATGEYGKAESLLRESLDLGRTRFPMDKYPQGHRELALSITALAQLHLTAGEYNKAEPLYLEALQMARAVLPTSRYPSHNRDLTTIIHHVAFLYQSMEAYDKAEPLSKEALSSNRAIYPKEKYPLGHRDLALSINNLALLQVAAGKYNQAEPLFREALTMCRALFPKEKYPQGHPDLATIINNLASLYLAAGEYSQAELLFREALDMQRRLLLYYAQLAAEAECLNYVSRQPVARDMFLSATHHLSGLADYDALWDSRAALTRLQERRHRDLMASRDQDTAELAHQLRIARLILARRLLNPLGDADQQRAEVQKLTDTKEALEKRIARKLKLAPTLPQMTPSPKRLAESLPEGTAFVDFYCYIDFEQDPHIKGLRGERRTPRYVAFVVRTGQPAARVELNEATPIERAWAAWRTAITAARLDEKTERKAAQALAKLVWNPLQKELPSALKTVYLAPAGVLHQVPWGALPGLKSDTILLDEYAICLVPHGPFLLERLEDKREARPLGDVLLAYGGIDYDNHPGRLVKPRDDVRGPLLSEKKRLRWGDLPGTAREQEQVVALARKVLQDTPISRSGRDASTKQLEEDLPGARYAHLATHGFFADPEFRSAFQVDPKAFERISKDRRGGARSPLVLSGLVLAGANRTGKDMAEDRGILTAEGLLGLRLDGLELAVLSACETGLGAEGGSEGVYGLQRAFHISGCKSVVASLWKVDDGATQALMALFYRNLWEKRLDPAESLRQAQLTLYRNPSAVEMVRRRGFVFAERDLPKDAVEPGMRPKRSPTAHWGAFTFSGVRPVLWKRD